MHSTGGAHHIISVCVHHHRNDAVCHQEFFMDASSDSRDVCSLQSSSWDPLGAPVVGTSGPIARAAGHVYHSSLAFRKDVQV